MLREMKLVIFENEKVIHTVTRQISEHEFVKSIEEFQVITNSIMTKLIEESGDSGYVNIEEEADDSDNVEEDVCVSSKKKKT